jgi:hypothetical protein
MFSSQLSNREPQNIEYRLLNMEGKKLHRSKFLTLDPAFSGIRYSIFKIGPFNGLLAYKI